MSVGQEQTTEELKMFVGGLSWDTTEESLGNYFAQFGDIAHVEVKRAPDNKPRGFGFVTFKDPASIEKVKQHPRHELDNKKIDPKIATAKNATPPGAPSFSQTQGAQEDPKKVFVGGLPPLGSDDTIDNLKVIVEGTLEAELRETFPAEPGKFVEKVEIKVDPNTGRHKGFGFVIFTSEKAADTVCRTHFYNIQGKSVEFKKAESRQKRPGGYRPQQSYGYQQWSGDQYGGSYATGYGTGGAGSDYHHQYNMYPPQQAYSQHNSPYAQQHQPYGQQPQTGQHGGSGAQMSYDQYSYGSSAQADSTAAAGYGQSYASYGGGYSSHQGSHPGYGGQPQPQQQQPHQQQYFGHPAR